MLHRCGDEGWGYYVCLAGVDQLAGLLSCFLRRRKKDMAVDIHSSDAQAFMGYLDVKALQEHDRSRAESEIVEAASV